MLGGCALHLTKQFWRQRAILKDGQTDSPVLAAIKSRRSLRRYRPDPVAREIVEALLEAAIWAPSAHNRQPFRFVVVQSLEQKTQLAAVMAARLRLDLAADGVPEASIEADAARSFARVSGAPVVIIACLTMRDMDVYSDARRAQNEYLMAVQSVAMAAQNLLLAAYDLGLGACWMCAPLFCPDVVCDVLQLPEDWQPQGLVTLGYPDQTREKTRHPLEKSVLWR